MNRCTMVIPVSKVLLLDLDGVVIQNYNLSRFVSMRVTSFVRKSLEKKIANISYHQAEKINRVLYSTYGHTLLGLQQMFHIDIGAEEFNNYVYDKNTIKYVSHFRNDTGVIAHAAETQSLLSVCDMKGIPVYVFSNAPCRWCETIIDMMSLPIDEMNILGSDHPIFRRSGQLKPCNEVYMDVSRLIRYRNPGIKKFVFVDDTMANLRPCEQWKDWDPILLLPGGGNIYSGSVIVCNSLLDIQTLV